MSNLSAQNPLQNAFQNAIQGKLKQYEQENIQSAESTGDFSNSQIDKSKINATPKATNVVVSGEFDIKGIKIGMTSPQVANIIKSNAKDLKKCGFDQGGVELYIYRDYTLYCNKSFSYFGSEPEFVEFHFVNNDNGKNDRLIWVRIGYYYSESNNRDPMPPLVKALAEKVKANPETINTPHSHASGVGTYEFIWSDSNKSKLIVSTAYENDLTGLIHRKQKIEITSADYDSVVESRKLKLKTLQQNAQQKAQQKKASDL